MRSLLSRWRFCLLLPSRQRTRLLTPGAHTLQLVLGDLNHVPHDLAVVSSVITINVTP